MSDDRPRNISTNELSNKLTDLERRADCLEKQYNKLIKRAGDLEYWTNSYMLMVERERKVASIIDLLMRRDNRSRLLLDYICIFFEILVKKLQKKGISVSNTKELWEGISAEETRNYFNSITTQLGFSRTEQEALMIVFEVIRERDFSVLSISESLIGNMRSRHIQADDHEEKNYYDTDISSLFLYLQIQDDLQTSVRGALRRAVAVAHCGLMGTDDTETSFDMSKLSSPDLVSRFLTSTPKAVRSTSAVEPSPDQKTQTQADQNVRVIRSVQNTSNVKSKKEPCVTSEKVDDIDECSVRLAGTTLSETLSSNAMSQAQSCTPEDSSAVVSVETSGQESQSNTQSISTINDTTFSDTDAPSSIQMSTDSQASCNSDQIRME